MIRDAGPTVNCSPLVLRIALTTCWPTVTWYIVTQYNSCQSIGDLSITGPVSSCRFIIMCRFMLYCTHFVTG